MFARSLQQKSSNSYYSPFTSNVSSYNTDWILSEFHVSSSHTTDWFSNHRYLSLTRVSSLINARVWECLLEISKNINKLFIMFLLFGLRSSFKSCFCLFIWLSAIFIQHFVVACCFHYSIIFVFGAFVSIFVTIFCFCWRYLSRGLNRSLTTNIPTHYLLDYATLWVYSLSLWNSKLVGLPSIVHSILFTSI